VLLLVSVRFTFAENIRNQVARVEFRHTTVYYQACGPAAFGHTPLYTCTIRTTRRVVWHTRGILPEPVTIVNPLSYLFLQKHSTFT
jgi:hypothetical protein